MEKHQSNYHVVVKSVILALSLLAVFIHVGNFTFLTMPSILFYAWHLLIGAVLILLYYPLGKNKQLNQSVQFGVYIIDWLLIVLIIVASAYVILNYNQYVGDMQNNKLTTEIIVLGGVMLLVVLEIARRVLGNILPLIAIVCIMYALFGNYIPGLFGHRGYSIQRVLLAVFSDRGVYGTPIATSAANVYLFLLFAAYLNVSGADIIFQDIAIALAGSKRGGPAKMAVIASAFFGTISGSVVANVVSTGAFTIPLMKRNGYRGEFAGAVESVASTGGQIMPPIMGAAAFVLSSVAGLPYATVCIAAFLPAVMYYLCLLKMVDLEAVKYNLKGLSQEEIPNLKDSIGRAMKLFVPVAVLLITMLGLGFTPMKSAIYAIAAIIICGLLDKRDRLTGKRILDGVVRGAKSLCTVVSACACAGIVVGMFSLTGLGLKFSNFIIQLGGNAMIPSLILSMLVCVILGMGLPTTAAYIVCATAIAPALTGLGIPVLAAHLFLLYFACISAITPPVAVAAYAASGIAEANPMRVGMEAVKLGITGFILPFAFVANTGYLTLGLNLNTLLTICCGFVICFSLACALQGYVENKITWIERIAYFGCVALTIGSNVICSLIGIILFVVLYGGRTLRFQTSKT